MSRPFQTYIATFAITILAILNIVQYNGRATQKREIDMLNARPPALRQDAPFINLAASEWAKKNGVAKEVAMKGRYAKVMHIGPSVCVSLNIELGGLGEAPVYCYISSSRKMIRRFDNVE